MNVCILASGEGSRMQGFGPDCHKALLPVGNKAVIGRIIDFFEKGLEKPKFVISVSEKKSSELKQYINIAHKNSNIEYVNVQRFEGPGSGPGQSLYECKQFLGEKFYFTSCDTIIRSPFPTTNDTSWVGVTEVEDIENWCSVVLNESKNVSHFVYKEKADTNLAFTGIAYVDNAQAFWDGLESSELISNEKQVNAGLDALISTGLKTEKVAWSDTGCPENYVETLGHFKKNYSFIGKTTDCTYQIDNMIIKYFENKVSVKNRYERGLQNKEAFCEVLDRTDNFYSYTFTPGFLLSSRQSYYNTKKFLNFAEEYIWNKKSSISLTQECKNFYLIKTLNRLDSFIHKNNVFENDQLIINGLECLSITHLLNQLTDNFYSTYDCTSFHGDLHDDNILITENSFKLIDWRESFDNNTDFGDKYYDLAKYLHTLEFNVHAMDNNLFSINEEDDGSYQINNDLSFNQLDATKALFDHIETFNYSAQRVKIINALIYINMAPLYKEKLSQYLYLIGRYQLNQTYINRGDNNEYFN